LNALGNITTAVETYTFVDTDYPSILFRLVMGTRKIIIDLVTEDTTIPNTVNPSAANTKRDDLASWFVGWLHSSKADQDSSSSAQIKIVGRLRTINYNPRNTESSDPDVGYSTFALSKNTFPNKTRIPNGRYRFLLRALKITGDVEYEEDYEAWLSPVMVFNAAH
jgi:hypothetical protein